MLFMMLLVLSVVLLGGAMVAAVSYMSSSEPRPLEKGGFVVWGRSGVLVRSTGAVRTASAGGGFLPASFCLEAQGKRLYIDPYGLGKVDKGDYVLITRDHPSHLSIRDIEAVYDEGTVVLCPVKAAEKLRGYHAKTASPGESVDWRPFHIEVVPVFSRGLSDPPGQGYKISVGEFILYHGGDTAYAEELESMKPATLVLMPVSGGSQGMSPEEAASLVNVMRPEAAMPMGYDLKKQAGAAFAKRVDPGIEVILYESKERIEGERGPGEQGSD